MDESYIGDWRSRFDLLLVWQEVMLYKDRGVFLNFLNRYGEKCKYVRVVVKTKCIGRNG